MSLLGLIRIPKPVASTTNKTEKRSSNVVVKQEPLSINIKKEPKTCNPYIPMSQMKIETMPCIKTEPSIVVKKEKPTTGSIPTGILIKSDPTISKRKRKKNASTNTVRPNPKKRKHRGRGFRFPHRKSGINDAVNVYNVLSLRDPFTLSNRELDSLNWAERVMARHNYPINESSYASPHKSPPLSPISYLGKNSDTQVSEFIQEDTETRQPLDIRISHWGSTEIDYNNTSEMEGTKAPEGNCEAPIIASDEFIEEGYGTFELIEADAQETPDNEEDIPAAYSDEEHDIEFFEDTEETAPNSTTTRDICETPDSELCEIVQQTAPTTACRSNEQTAVIADTLELAVVDFGKPGGRYSYEQGVLIIKTLGELVVSHILKNIGLLSPTFGKPSWHDGVVVLDCKDQLSYNFAKTTVSAMRLWRRGLLRAVPPAKIPFMSKCQLSIPDFGINKDQLIDVLKTQNPSINTSKWTIIQEDNVVTNGLKQYTLLMTDPPITLIESKRMKLFFGAGEATLKLVDYNLGNEV